MTYRIRSKRTRRVRVVRWHTLRAKLRAMLDSSPLFSNPGQPDAAPFTITRVASGHFVITCAPEPE